MSKGTLNKVMLIGNLGDDPKMHYFDDGGCIARFPIATTESYMNKQKEQIDDTQWHNIVVRNKAAEICEKYLTKGDKVYIEGKIRTRQWQDKEGQDRYTTEIITTDFNFLTPKKNTMLPDQNAEQSSPSPTLNDDNPEEDLPF